VKNKFTATILNKLYYRGLQSLLFKKLDYQFENVADSPEK